jgi:tetratricopeptide (TPR) repeat protein
VVAAFEILAAGLALASVPQSDANAPAAETRTVRATAGQMLSLAEEMLRRGKGRDAEVILETLASDLDPTVRNEARFRRALLLEAKGHNSEAAFLLRRVLDEKPQSVRARLQLAQVLQSLGDTDGALRELRAVRSNGLPPAVARLVDRYSAALRAQRPFGASLTIAVAPDSNINHSTSLDTLGTVLGDFQIDKGAKAKSGTGLQLNAQAFRRFAVSDDASLLVRASGLANLYAHSRFNDVIVDLALGPELIFGHDRLQLELGATQRWFGQRPYVRSARLAGTFSHPLGARSLLRLSGTASLIDNQLNELEDGKGYWGRLQIERALTSTTGVAASLAIDRQALKDAGYATKGWRAGLTGWRDLGRITFTATAEFGRLHADKRLWLFPDRREDHYARYSLGASFRQLQFAGFAPLLQFSVERNRSNIAFYDYRRARTEIGVDRAF